MKVLRVKNLFLGFCLVFLCFALASPSAAQLDETANALAPQPTLPVLELQPGDPAHQAQMSLGAFELPLVALTNPNQEASLQFQVLALDKEGDQRRSLVAEIEAGGSLSLTLEGPRPFQSLIIVARGPFSGEVSDLRGKYSADLDVQGPAEQELAQKSIVETCGGDWTLSCFFPSTCTYVSPAIPGEVYFDTTTNRHNVSWNNQFPYADWRTTNGSCWVNWKESISKPGCPSRATNCYGERYRVTGTIAF